MAAATDIESFMEGPLVTWLRSCLDHPKCVLNYEDLVDGCVLHEVVLQINPEPDHSGVTPSMGNAAVRVRNLDVVLKNIKAVYEEELCQDLLAVPDCMEIGRHPETKAGLENMKLLLLLLLGCAVQSPNKEFFIHRIKELSVDMQCSIVECIKRVTSTQEIVLSHDVAQDAVPADLMISHVRRLVRERDNYMQQWLSLCQERGDSVPGPSSNGAGDAQRRMSAHAAGNDSHHLAVELADWKARLRKLRQELEEKSEALAESKEEVEHNKQIVSKLRAEVQELTQEARSAKLYRDELDAVRERAERVDRLETEVQRYREKLSDIEFYKTRVEELREDNRVLMETREMLEEQVQRARKRSDQALALETEVIRYKQQLNDMALEMEATQEKLQETIEENSRLQLLTKATLAENSALGDDSSLLEENGGGSNDDSLSEQLSSNAQARALRLELENRRLQSTIESLKESSFLENSTKILDLEKEKKKLSMKVDQLQASCKQLTEQKEEMVQLVKDALDANKALQENLDSTRMRYDKLDQELKAEQNRREEAELAVENSSKEKQRLQCSLDSTNRRIEELERQLDSTKSQLEHARAEADTLPALQTRLEETQSKCDALEKEAQAALKEMTKLKQTVELKDGLLDQRQSELECLQKDIAVVNKELEEAKADVTRLQEVEREGRELASSAAVEREALTNLQSDLVNEKLSMQNLRGGLERIGVTFDRFDDADILIERVAACSEVQRAVLKVLKLPEHGSGITTAASSSSEFIAQEACGAETNSNEVEEAKCRCKDLQNEMATLQASLETANSENAHLQVTVSTLQSRVASLSAQHTALQMANTQLVTEKEELVKERGIQQSSHEQLLLDQVTLQSLHEQLSSDYESLLEEREGLRATQRNLKSELRLLQDSYALLEHQQKSCLSEKETLTKSSLVLSNSHAELTEDFRNLYAASKKQWMNFHSLQEEYRELRAEHTALKLRHTQLQGELSKRCDHSSSLELDVSRLQSKCEMLLQMNAGLDEDRRSLMDHVSQLLAQYHELLFHSLEDREHFHLEEKMFTDKLNNLSRQKEKLEEKIMEHYRRMDSCSTKKRSFGASLVERVKKASSDFMNKSRRRSWHEDTRTVDNQTPVAHQISESECEESDTSVEDVQTCANQGAALDRSSLSLGSAGTRRTVYYTEDENNRSSPHLAGSLQAKDSGEDSEGVDNRVTSTPTPSTTQPAATTSSSSSEPRMLVYNRISTVIGDSTVNPPRSSSPMRDPHWNSGTPTLPHNKPGDPNCKRGRSGGQNGAKGADGTDRSFWYEYGCV